MDNKTNTKKESFIERLKCSIIFLLFPMIMFGLLSPLEIFVGNADEFLFGTGDFIWIFLGITLLAGLVLALVISLLPTRLRHGAYICCFAVSLMAYLQNMFLNKTLMRTDGSKVEWDKLASYTRVNLIIWISVFALICLLPLIVKKWKQIYMGVSGFLGLIQLVAALSIIFTAKYSIGNDNHYALDASKQLDVAANENVIVIILDRYANGAFDDAREDDASFDRVFADFTYYDNANSKYNYTFPSMAYMMTGVDPDCTETTSDYKYRAWTTGMSASLHDDLAAKGYDYRLYTGSGRHVYYDASYLVGSIDNLIELPPTAYKVNSSNLTFLFTKMTLFKYAPYIVKPKLEIQNFQFDGIVEYDGVDYCMEDNASFMEQMCEKGISIDETMDNAVTVMLLSGIHTPYTIGADGSRVCDNDSDLRACQLGINVILDRYFSELKQLGVYDDATIIVTADHGLYIESNDPQPIYLIKLPGQSQETMQINSAPISTEDYMATIYELVCGGDSDNKYGKSIFYWQELDQRTRSCQYPNNGFDVFTYTGNRMQLRELIEEGSCTRIEATEDWD